MKAARDLELFHCWYRKMCIYSRDILNSFVQTKILTEKELEVFLKSIKTISSEINTNLYKLSSKNLKINTAMETDTKILSQKLLDIIKTAQFVKVSKKKLVKNLHSQNFKEKNK